jgi:hypothetical protein
MRSNNELTILKEINNIEYAKYKYFFIGFLISLIPYSLILLIATKLTVSKAFVYTLVFITILSCVANAFILSNNIYNKLITFFENKYQSNYKKIKDSII